MSWEPVTREELVEEIESTLVSADDSVRAAWERIRIEPEKWQCRPWGDEGGGFWAVAVSGDQVIWFNDIEGGFNTSPFTQRGVIDRYYCNQDDFAELLRTLPEAQAAVEFAANAPASEVPGALSGPGRIVDRRTTYWCLRTSSGLAARVHFSGAAELHVAGDAYDTSDLLEDHPLLTDYAEGWAEVYLSNGQHRVQEIVSAAEPKVRDTTHGWRSLTQYLAHGGRTASVLCAGNGVFLRAPESVASVVIEVIRAHGASASLIRDHGARPGHRALLLGTSYVVAQAFRFALDAGSP